MSLPLVSIFIVPERTAEIAHAAFPKGNRYMQMRDTLGTVYTHAHFADLYPPVGQPAAAPWRLALVTIMQCAENLTDRQAAEAVRGRIAAAAQREHSPQLELPFYSRERAFAPQTAKNVREQQ